MNALIIAIRSCHLLCQKCDMINIARSLLRCWTEDLRRASLAWILIQAVLLYFCPNFHKNKRWCHLQSIPLKPNIVFDTEHLGSETYQLFSPSVFILSPLPLFFIHKSLLAIFYVQGNLNKRARSLNSTVYINIDMLYDL